MTQRGRPEHDLERGSIAPFYGGIGIDVYATSARVWAKGVTPGIADLCCFFERQGFHFFHESKVPGKKQTEAQYDFEGHCQKTGVPYVLGGIEEAMEFICWLGLGVRVNDTVCFYPRDKWPSAAQSQAMLPHWPSSLPNLDAKAKYGYRRAA